MISDGRRDQAKVIPIMEVAERLGIAGLRRSGNEHVGPCPVCGGHDKLGSNRFGINPARGIWNCRSCNVGGDQLALAQHVLGCEFGEALDYLVGGADIAPDPAVVAERKANAEAAEKRRQDIEETQRARAIRDAREIWNAGKPGQGTPAEAYLVGRGIKFPAWPPTLRFLADHPYMKAQSGSGVREWHRGPCMVAAIQSPEGAVVAVHRTWIDAERPGQKAKIIGPDGKEMPAKLVRGSKKGGAIRLTAMGETGRMVMGEGIETTASAIVAGVWPGAAFWAGVDLGNMSGRQVKEPGKRHSGKPDLSDGRAWVPPEGIKRLLFIQDGDSAEKVTRAKLEAGAIRAMMARPGLKATILRADAGTDLNDMLREELEGWSKDGL